MVTVRYAGLKWDVEGEFIPGERGTFDTPPTGNDIELESITVHGGSDDLKDVLADVIVDGICDRAVSLLADGVAA